MANKEIPSWEPKKITPFKELSERLAAVKKALEIERERIQKEIAQKKERNG